MRNAQAKKGDGQSMNKDSVFKKEQAAKDKDDEMKNSSNESETVDVIFEKDAFLHWSGKSYKRNDNVKITMSDYEKLIKTNHVKIKE